LAARVKHFYDGLRLRKRDRIELESHDEYFRVVAQIDEKTRVIECAAGLRWIVQRRKGGDWAGASFCLTKAALLRCGRGWVQHPALLALPDRFPEEAIG
jgi:hypothetical protein